MKVCVIGTGYVGLVGAAMFADWGNDVVGVDIDAKKLARIEKGDMPIYEPGLEEIVSENLKPGRLSFTTSLKKGMKDAELVFICVGTPQGDMGRADLKYVFKVAEDVGKNLNGYKVIVIKSTVPVGTNEKVTEIIRENAQKGAKFDVVSNPEFLREGSSVEDMRNTDRTVIGSNSKRALKVLKQFYAHLGSPIVECDVRSAELIKYASNFFLATKITFINEVAQLCDSVGADVVLVAKGMGLDSRIGGSFLQAGMGYGGSCFPKDVEALQKISMDHAFNFKILRGVLEANDDQKNYYIGKITDRFGKNLSGMKFACLGLAFKDDTDDVRESISIKVIRRIRGMGADIRACDPQAIKNAKEELGNDDVAYCKDCYEAVKGADAICILTEWGEFAGLDLAKVKKLAKGKVIFDGRNLLDPASAAKEGFEYYGMGRNAI